MTAFLIFSGNTAVEIINYLLSVRLVAPKCSRVVPFSALEKSLLV